MPCPGPAEDEYSPPAPTTCGQHRVVWVGRIAPVKRLELMLEVAERLPQVMVDIVGGPDCPAGYLAALEARAAGLPNVRLRGPVHRARMAEVYRQATCLCCTSAYEGFPNAFLEAWSRGLPVVTTVDPDELVGDLGLGLVAHHLPGLVAAIRGLIDHPATWRQMSANARRYWAGNHHPNAALPRFESLFIEVCTPVRPSPAAR